MILFFISLTLTIITAFFITSIFEQKNFIKILIFMLILMFASLILNIEILSLLSKISANNILIMNCILTLTSGFFWFKKGKPLFKIKYKRFFKSLYYAIISDKYLLILGIAFLFMCGVSLYLIAIMPVVNMDAEQYHMLRSLFWIDNGNLNHFNIADIRNLVMPINSEIFYLWLLIFLKKQLWFGMASFCGFLLSITSLYGIMGKIGIKTRSKLWTIFILSSLPSVIVQISGTETDIIIAGLVLCSIYLFWDYFKNQQKISLYFSALSYAIALGTKNTAAILVIPVGIWMLWLSIKYLKKGFYKPLVNFLIFGIINFIIFSSYNYILNILEWGCPFGYMPFVNIHRNIYGLKGFLATFIKHLFMFFDFTGFHWDKTLGQYIYNYRENILANFSLNTIPDGLFSMKTNNFNNSLIECLMGMGILGFLVFLPCWIYSMIKPIFLKTKQSIYISSFGWLLMLSIIAMSLELMFMVFNIRFITSFCVICGMVLSCSYTRKNNPLKFIITLFALFGLTIISTHLFARPFNVITGYFKQGATIHKVREIASCYSFSYKKNFLDTKTDREMCRFKNEIKKYNKRNKILYFGNTTDTLLTLKMLMFEGYDIDYALAEDINKTDIKKYNIIITSDNTQISTYIKNPHPTSDNYYPADKISCVYSQSNEAYINDNKDLIIYSICEFAPTFFEDKGYKIIAKIPYDIRISAKEQPLYLNYKFYENTDNPVIK